MSGDPRKLFSVTKKMLNQVKESPFPEHCNWLTLANELEAFFKKKISDVRFELDAAATVHNNHSTLAPATNCFQPSSSSGFLSYFELLSKDSVKKLVLSVPTKSCFFGSCPLESGQRMFGLNSCTCLLLLSISHYSLVSFQMCGKRVL